jgi:4-alpha-glucanotransferase
MARDGYAWWRERVRTVREVFHLFRVDHILGFYRIYSFPWRPQRNEEFLPLEPEEAKQRTGGRLPGFRPRPDDTLEDREANRREGEQLLRVLLEEVGEYRLIGEDLGVVPDYVRPSLASLGIAGFKVPQWEKAHDGRLISGEHYAPLSICTYATHDHDPIRVMWESWAEIIRRADAGDASAQAAAGGARWEMQLIMDFAGFGQAAGAIPYDDSVRERLLSALFRTRSWIAVAMITDLLGLTQRINVPGAAADTNWSTRFDKTICEWREDPEVRRKMENILRLVQESGRA